MSGPMSKPLAIDIFCGLHGWAEGLIAEGFDVVGVDIVDMCRELGMSRPRGVQLVLQDVRTIHGRQFKDAALIVASPPCQAYSWRAMPWKAAKAAPPPSNELFDACFRIQREACEAAGRHIPLVVENVRGAQPWVGRSRWNYGSFHLWGDVPALMPISAAFKSRGLNWSDRSKRGQDFTRCAAKHQAGLKGAGGSWFYGNKGGQRATSSKSTARKRYQALIAKIPLPLSRHIAAVYHPQKPQLKFLDAQDKRAVAMDARRGHE